MRVLFLIRSLEAGGAERQLVELVTHLDRTAFEIAVVTFYGHGRLARELEQLPHVQLTSLEKRGRGDAISFMKRLFAIARAFRPDAIHGYMGGANELATVLGRALGCQVVWGLRASDVDLSYYDWAATALFRLGAWLSRTADLIIINSHAGREHYVRHGYSAAHMVVIPNGIDTERFRRDAAGGLAIRCTWGVAKNEALIGVVGRLDPMKDHATFLRAAARLARQRQDVRFVVVGQGGEARTRELNDLARSLGVDSRIIWVGEVEDMPSVYSALDVTTSSSAFGEGFSNSLGEAMSSESLCVATSVGDAARILGDAGVIVPPRADMALSEAWGMLLDLAETDRRDLGRRARQRIVSEFSVGALKSGTEAVLSGLRRRRVPVDAH